ncbi:MAG: PQQ-binding-like beta-propeller repeat protein [Candidatus Latescibacteria bacterium]|nr:PQQ-binding-like beta-propeller repeat protein [Candidatus Latescibacterota bacterium]
MPEPFFPTDLCGPVLLVLPDGLAECARPLRQAIAARGGRPELLEQADFRPGHFADFQVIACGHLANNAALRRLYTARRTFVDTFFPGPEGYFVKSVPDPFGHRRNCVVVGASDQAALPAAIEALAAKVLQCQGHLDRVHAHRFSHPLPAPPTEEQGDTLVREALATWNGGWNASPFRDGRLREFLWNFYLTDDPGWGRLIPPIFAGSLQPWLEERRAHPETYHCFFWLHHYIQLWDLVEDSPLFTGADRAAVAGIFTELLRHLNGLFYMTERVNPAGDLRQNHSTFIALSLAVGQQYLQRRHGNPEFGSAALTAQRIFAGQASSYKPNDDAGVGYAWLVPRETLDYHLLHDDYRYLEEGHIARLCDLVALSTDNMRSEVSYGDTGGYTPCPDRGWEGRLWPLMAALWHRGDPRHLWLLNWLARGRRPALLDSLAGLYSVVEFGEEGFRLPGCTPREPADLLGVCALPLPEAALRAVTRRTPAAHHPVPGRAYFDKLSLRSSFEAQDEYLLLEGVGTFCHGHEDTNTILRLTWKNRAWLADGDYVRAAPKFHNAVVVCRDGAGVHLSPGEGLVIPPLAALTSRQDGPLFGLVQSEAAQYNGLDWRRCLCWRKGRYMAVIDQLRCQLGGTYELRCHWRLVGEVRPGGQTLRLRQQGEDFHLHQASPGAWELAPDAHEGGLWKAYPFADPVIQVLHQTQERALAPGEDLGFLNLFTPHPEVRVERLGELLLRVKDGQTTTLLGAGPLRLGEVQITGPVFALSLDGEVLTIQGADQVEVRSGDRVYAESFQGAYRTLDARSPVGRQLRRLLLEEEPIPGPRPTAAALPQDRGFRTRWQHPVAVTTAAVHGEELALSTTEGLVQSRSLVTGQVQWQADLGAPATCLLLADLDGDRAPELLAGTADSQLVLLRQGQAQWRQPLRNIWGRPARVNALALADLEATGQASVLAGTAGWYVNAFAADGTPRWANWFRYHPITALAAADVDGDGRAEVMAGNVYSTPLTVHNHDGTFRWSTLEQVGSEGNATTPRRGIGLTHLCLWDADGDGVREIAYGTADGWLYLVKPQDGAEVWRYNLVGEVRGLALTASGLVAASEFGGLYCFGEEGQVRWRHHLSRWIHRLVLSGEVLVAETKAGLLRCGTDGGITGFLPLEQPSAGLWPCPGGVLLARAVGPLSALDLPL